MHVDIRCLFMQNPLQLYCSWVELIWMQSGSQCNQIEQDWQKATDKLFFTDQKIGGVNTAVGPQVNPQTAY